MSLNFLRDIKSYPATHTCDYDGIWVGVVCEKATGLVLDAKWHGDGEQERLDMLLDTWIGQKLEALDAVFTKAAPSRV